MPALLRPFSNQLLGLSGNQVRPAFAGLPQIDWSHPLAEGLVFYALDLGGGIFIDLVSGVYLTFNGTSQTATLYGGAITNYDTSNGGSVYLATPAAVKVGKPFSFATAFIVRNAAIAQYIYVRQGSGGVLGWLFVLISGTLRAQINNSATDTQVGNAIAPSNNVYHSALCTLNPAGNAAFFFDGAQQGSTTAITPAGIATADNIIFGDNILTSKDSPFGGTIHYGAFWNVARPASDALQLHLDPYCFLLPPEAELPVLKGVTTFSVTTDFGVVIELLRGVRSDPAPQFETSGLLRSDVTPNLESRTSMRMDLGIPAEILVGVRNDQSIWLEDLLAARSDISLDVESTSNFRADSSPFTLESVLGVREDNGIRLESLTGINSNWISPDEINSLIQADSNPISDEVIASLRMDTTPRSEVLAGVRNDFSIRSENLSGVITDIASTIEIAGQVAVNSDASLQLESISSLRSDTNVVLEEIAALRLDNSIRLEAVSSSQSDFQVKNETLAGVREDINVSTEDRLGVSSHLSLPDEVLSLQSADNAAKMENLLIVLADRPPNSEITGLLSVTADSSIQVEFSSLLRSDNTSNFEDISTIRSDSGLSQEALAGVAGNTTPITEWVVAVRKDSSDPFEFTGAAGVTMNAAVPLEWLSSIRSDFTSSIESLSSVRSDNEIGTSILVSVLSDVAVKLEDLSRVQNDKPLANSIVSGVLANLSLYDEVITGISITANFSLGLEWSVHIQADLGLQDEVVTTIQALISDSPLQLEWFIQRLLVLNPNLIAIGQPRSLIGVAQPRNRIIVAMSNRMAQTNTLEPPIDAVVEIETVTWDFGRVLKPGVTITAVVSTTASVVSNLSTAPDPNPQSRLIGSTQITTSPKVPTMPNAAVMQLFGTAIANVCYLLQCVVTTSDGQQLSAWQHFYCKQPA